MNPRILEVPMYILFNVSQEKFPSFFEHSKVPSQKQKEDLVGWVFGRNENCDASAVQN